MSNSNIRRRVRRRREGVAEGSRSGGLSLGEGGDEEELDPFDLNDSVKDFSRVVSDTEGTDFAPKMRLLEMEEAKDDAYSIEHRQEVLHRLLMRKVPLHEIAKQLNVSIRTVRRDKKELKKRLMEGAKRLDIHELIGETVGFYDEVGAMALRAASMDKIPMSARIAAMRTALGTKNDMHRFLNTAGVFEVLKYSQSETNGVSDIERLIATTEKLLGEQAQDSTTDDEPITDDLNMLKIEE